jgi:hypothetical protein
MSLVSSIFSVLSKAPPAGGPSQSPAPSTSQLSLDAVTFSTRRGCTGSSFLLSMERTAALVEMLKKCRNVSLDRVDGTITFEKVESLPVTVELLQVAVEYFHQRTKESALYLSSRSPLRNYMSPEHLARVESILQGAALDGKSLRYAGRVFTDDTTRPYSTKGQPPFAQFPEAFRHGDYQFFNPRHERAAMMQFISNLCEPNQVVLPVIQLNSSTPSADSTVSVKPIWLLAGLGDMVRSELEARDPLTRFYELVFDWRGTLNSSVFDLPATLHGLASALGLTIREERPEFEGDFNRFEISSVSNTHKVAAFVSPPTSEGYREVQIRRGALRG